MLNNLVVAELNRIVAKQNVLTGDKDTEYYRTGFRTGYGKALAVVFPQSLLQLWQVVQVGTANNTIMLIQAAKTGLTGGSTPDADDYDRQVIIINTKALKGLQLLNSGKEFIALPGDTLAELEVTLEKHKREPHSVIGSSCLGASIIGGICNNSGGALVRRGPAFSEMSLYAQINASGQLELINNLGLELGTTAEQILTNLEQQNYRFKPLEPTHRTWADDYASKVRDLNANTPARFNADPSYLSGAAGCAGKVVVFAVRLSSFAQYQQPQVLYIGTNSETTLIQLKRQILTKLDKLPISGEYIQRECFACANRYGKPVFLALKYFGSKSMPGFFKLKNTLSCWLQRLKIFPNNSLDILLDWLTRCLPKHLPKRLLDFHAKYAHHLILALEIDQLEDCLKICQTVLTDTDSNFFRCSKVEAQTAMLHRFVVGAATISYCNIKHGNSDALVSLDIALARNDQRWLLNLPSHLNQQIEKVFCCGHFLCNVNHSEIVLKAGTDAVAFKQSILTYLDARGARYPAEHNVGHSYHTSSEHQRHWRQLDPTNSFNSGIGKTSKHQNWQ